MEHNSSNSFTYSVIDNEVTITGYSGQPEFIVIPNEIDGHPVTEIRDNAFYQCSTLKQIIFPDSLRHMGHHCFYQCTSLESADLPEDLIDMGMGCFCQCSSLSYVTLPESITVVPDSCFRNCVSLTEITIPDNVVEIEKFAFSGCSALSSVSMDEKLSAIGDFAFFMCDSLNEIYIPPSVDRFGVEALGYTPDSSGHTVADSFCVLAEAGSPAENYAENNSIELRTSGSFSLQDSSNAPVDVPDAFGIAGLILLTAALVSVLLKKVSGKHF